MYISDEVMAWIADIGVEIRIAKTRRDLSVPGLHLCNPTLADLMCACYEVAMGGACKVIICHLWPLEP